MAIDLPRRATRRADCDPASVNQPDDGLRLGREDALLLWTVLENFRTMNTHERWARLDRIILDLKAILRKQEERSQAKNN